MEFDGMQERQKNWIKAVLPSVVAIAKIIQHSGSSIFLGILTGAAAGALLIAIFFGGLLQ